MKTEKPMKAENCNDANDFEKQNREEIWNTIQEAERFPLLHEVALNCYNGAVNPRGIVYALNRALQEHSMQPSCLEDNIDYEIIIGQLAFLSGFSLGPSENSLKLFCISHHLV